MKENEKTEAAFPGFEERAISLSKANLLGLVLLVLCFGATFVIYHLVWGKIDFTKPDNILTYTAVVMLCLIAGIVVHELIHGLFFGLSAPHHFSDITFGVIWN